MSEQQQSFVPFTPFKPSMAPFIAAAKTGLEMRQTIVETQREMMDTAFKTGLKIANDMGNQMLNFWGAWGTAFTPNAPQTRQ